MSVAVLAAVVLVPAALAGQGVRGVVANLETLDRVSGAAVLLLDSAGALVGVTQTDTAGQFALEAPGGGPHTLLSYRQGFHEPDPAVLELVRGQVLELRINLRPNPVELEAIVVTANAARSAAARRFQRRLQLGTGVGFGRDDLDAIQPTRLDDVLRLVPGARAQGRGRAAYMAVNHNRCRPAIVIDGRESPLGAQALDGLPWDWIVGLEVFRSRADLPSDIRVRYRSAFCGVVSLWTIWTR